MFDKKSMLLFVSCWLLLAVLSLPSGASAASSPQVVSDAGTGSSDTFPLVTNQFAVRQAHLAYLAVKEEVGMQAAIRYIAARNGSTGTLSTLMVKTDTSARAITSAVERVLDAELENLRGFTRSFRGETDLQMHVIDGHADELRAYVQSAVEGSFELQQLLDTYWRVRENNELSDFDLRVIRAQETLGTLWEDGYEISPAQEKLEEIVTMRTDLATALRTRNNAGIELSHKKIHATSIEYARIIQNIRSMGSADSRLGQKIDRGIGVITRSGMVNADLDQSGIETTRAKELVILGKSQILAAQNFSRDRDVNGVHASLSEFQDTLKALRDTYREILVKEDLSQPVAQGVLSIAQSLDVTAAQMEAL